MSTVAVDIAQARAVKNQLVERLASVKEVNGIGLVRLGGGWAVKVNFDRPVVSVSVPECIDGVVVLTEVVGPIESR